MYKLVEVYVVAMKQLGAPMRKGVVVVTSTAIVVLIWCALLAVSAWLTVLPSIGLLWVLGVLK